jgi:ABC-type oligopeptide transport system substrate-binding subunit
MRVDLVSMPNYVETLERLSVGAADLAVFMGPPPSLNPASVFDRFGSKQGLAFYANADYDALLSRSAAQNDRAEALQSLNNKLIDDGAVAPLVEDHSLWLVGSGFTPAFGPDGDVGDLGEWTTLG